MITGELKNKVDRLWEMFKDREHLKWSVLRDKPAAEMYQIMQGGAREQYNELYGETPLGELVRSIVGLDRQTANEAFSRFLTDAGLDSRRYQ